MMNHRTFDRADFDRGEIDSSSLHLEMVARFGADFSHVERRGDEIQIHFRNEKPIADVRAIVALHRSAAVPFDPHRDVGG